MDSGDEYGFATQLTQQQAARHHTRTWTAASQWSARYSVQVSVPPPRDVADLILTHGIAPALRPNFWLAAVSPLTTNAAAYAALAGRMGEVDQGIASQIELDLPRTFSDQSDFAAGIATSYCGFDGSRSGLSSACEAVAASAAACVVGGGGIHDAVRRMLRAFALLHPSIGYLQSLNFTAGFALLVLGRDREADAFSVFEFLAARALGGYYSEQMAMLKVDCEVFQRLLEERLPAVAAHMAALGISDMFSLFLPRWLLCIFLNAWPVYITVRVWDALLMEQLQAPRFLLELSLAVTRMLQADLLACGDFASAAGVLKAVGTSIIDPSELTLMTRSPECSLQARPINEWRSLLAPQMMQQWSVAAAAASVTSHFDDSETSSSARVGDKRPRGTSITPDGSGSAGASADGAETGQPKVHRRRRTLGASPAVAEDDGCEEDVSSSSPPPPSAAGIDASLSIDAGDIDVPRDIDATLSGGIDVSLSGGGAISGDGPGPAFSPAEEALGVSCSSSPDDRSALPMGPVPGSEALALGISPPPSPPPGAPLPPHSPASVSLFSPPVSLDRALDRVFSPIDASPLALALSAAAAAATASSSSSLLRHSAAYTPGGGAPEAGGRSVAFGSGSPKGSPLTAPGSRFPPHGQPQQLNAAKLLLARRQSSRFPPARSSGAASPAAARSPGNDDDEIRSPALGGGSSEGDQQAPGGSPIDFMLAAAPRQRATAGLRFSLSNSPSRASAAAAAAAWPQPSPPFAYPAHRSAPLGPGLGAAPPRSQFPAVATLDAASPLDSPLPAPLEDRRVHAAEPLPTAYRYQQPPVSLPLFPLTSDAEDPLAAASALLSAAGGVPPDCSLMLHQQQRQQHAPPAHAIVIPALTGAAQHLHEGGEGAVPAPAAGPLPASFSPCASVPSSIGALTTGSSSSDVAQPAAPRRPPVPTTAASAPAQQQPTTGMWGVLGSGLRQVGSTFSALAQPPPPGSDAAAAPSSTQGSHGSSFGSLTSSGGAAVTDLMLMGGGARRGAGPRGAALQPPRHPRQYATSYSEFDDDGSFEEGEDEAAIAAAAARDDPAARRFQADPAVSWGQRGPLTSARGPLIDLGSGVVRVNAAAAASGKELTSGVMVAGGSWDGGSAFAGMRTAGTPSREGRGGVGAALTPSSAAKKAVQLALLSPPRRMIPPSASKRG